MKLSNKTLELVSYMTKRNVRISLTSYGLSWTANKKVYKLYPNGNNYNLDIFDVVTQSRKTIVIQLSSITEFTHLYCQHPVLSKVKQVKRQLKLFNLLTKSSEAISVGKYGEVLVGSVQIEPDNVTNKFLYKKSGVTTHKTIKELAELLKN